MDGTGSQTEGTSIGAPPPRGRATSGIALVVGGLMVAVFGLVAALTDLGAEHDVTTFVGLADDDAAEPVASQTPAQFVERLGAAMADGEVTLLVDRLDPAVIERYGREQCQAYLTTQTADPTISLVVRSTGEPGPYSWQADGLTTEVPEAIVVEVDRSSGAGIEQATIVVRGAGGDMTWFADCGTPAG